jgi:hypothetical protein
VGEDTGVFGKAASRVRKERVLFLKKRTKKLPNFAQRVMDHKTLFASFSEEKEGLAYSPPL